IRDVDWESEESTPAADTPQEEHVAVRPSESEPIVIADEPDTAGPASSIEDEDDEDDEDSWYDTSVLEPIDELMGEAIEDANVGDDLAAVADASDADTDQGGLFDVPDASGEGDGDDGSLSDDETPSPEDIEAAAEHFSGSIHVDDALDEEPDEGVVSVV